MLSDGLQTSSRRGHDLHRKRAWSHQFTFKSYTPEGWIGNIEVLWDGDADGTANDRQFYQYVYDSIGNTLTAYSFSDTNFDGSDDSVTVTNNTFDLDNRLTEMVTDSDYDANGVIDNTRTITNSYDGCESF